MKYRIEFDDKEFFRHFEDLYLIYKEMRDNKWGEVVLHFEDGKMTKIKQNIVIVTSKKIFSEN